MKHTIRFHYTVRWDEEVEIDVPEGSTQSQIDALIAAAEKDIAYNPPLDDVDGDGWDWVGMAPQAVTAQWVDVPTFKVGKHTWACDGWAAVRSDAPPPTERQDSVSHIVPADAAKFVDGAIKKKATAVDPSLRYHERYRALLEYADDRRQSGQPIVLYRAGEAIALIMPNVVGTLDPWGKP